MLRQQRAQRLLEFADLVLFRIDRHDLGQGFGNEVGVLVDNAVIQLQRRLAVVGIACNMSPGQRPAHRSGTSRLRILYVLSRRHVVIPRGRRLGEFAVVMSDLQRQ